ncbi:hypothetical protein LZ32DRAFT_25157 [Colletotrichum eremochloae]|nr:hypothetical protein LZ32DRAFT_25157 [Colletotrichum eremochloae]
MNDLCSNHPSTPQRPQHRQPLLTTSKRLTPQPLMTGSHSPPTQTRTSLHHRRHPRESQ